MPIATGTAVAPGIRLVPRTRSAVADAALAPFVRQFAFADRAWFDAQPWTSLRNWLDAFIASPRFQRVMTKYPVWQSGDEPFVLDWNA